VSVQALSCAMAIRGVSASEKLVMLVLANFADEAMSCWPSHKRLADDTGLTQRTVLSVLRTLEDKRLLSRAERKRADGSRTSDKITLHFSGEVISPRGETISGGGEITDTGVGKPTAGGGEIISPLTTFEPSTEPSVKLVSDANASGAAAPDDPDTSAWRRAKILLMAQGGMDPQGYLTKAAQALTAAAKAPDRPPQAGELGLMGAHEKARQAGLTLKANDYRQPCPQCSPNRIKKKDPCLHVTVTRDEVRACCFHCGWGAVFDDVEQQRGAEVARSRGPPTRLAMRRGGGSHGAF
jgi:hypothetical protein